MGSHRAASPVSTQAATHATGTYAAAFPVSTHSMLPAGTHVAAPLLRSSPLDTDVAASPVQSLASNAQKPNRSQKVAVLLTTHWGKVPRGNNGGDVKR